MREAGQESGAGRWENGAETPGSGAGAGWASGAGLRANRHNFIREKAN